MHIPKIIIHLKNRRNVMMWVKYIKNTKLLMQLFNNVPELKDVEIEQFNMNYYGRTIVTTVDDEFITILVTGEGLDNAIQMIEQ